MILFILFR